MEIGEERRCPPTVVSRTAGRYHAEHEVHGDHGHQEDHGRRGKDSTAPSSVEVEDRRAARFPAFSEQQACDHEAGNHEEDVDADEAACQAGNAGVVENDERHCHSTQTLDIRSKVPVARCSPSLVSGR